MDKSSLPKYIAAITAFVAAILSIMSYFSAPEKTYELHNSVAGATLVTKGSGLQSGHVCLAISGTEIILLDETAKQFGLDMWQKIQIESGECKGKVGWVDRSNIVLN